ncbi:MAG: hypothetical protein ACRDE2_11970 [Chitinophagaceae bacterium]
MEFKSMTAYAFERTCGIANGYLKKQYNGKGSIGSETLEKIYHYYPDLNVLWLLVGEGEMIIRDWSIALKEEEKKYLTVKDEMIAILQNQIAFLEKRIEDKDKIISLLESQLDASKKIIKR